MNWYYTACFNRLNCAKLPCNILSYKVCNALDTKEIPFAIMTNTIIFIHTDGIVQDCSISIASALESGTKPSILLSQYPYMSNESLQVRRYYVNQARI